MHKDLLIHYMLEVPEIEDGRSDRREAEAETRTVEAGNKAFVDKIEPDSVKDEG